MAVLLIGISGTLLMQSIVNKADRLQIQEVNLSKAKDGLYVGEYRIDPVLVKTEVTIRNHKIKNIQIVKHQNGLGRDAEQIIKTIIDRQSLDVDVVSGATVSSKCILKAVETSLNKEKT